MKKNILILIASLLMVSGCAGYEKTNTGTQLFYGLFASTAPVLNSLTISAVDSSSITLAQPTLLSNGNPLPTVMAYFGLNGTISVVGSTVSNYLQGPIDVYSSGYVFGGLSSNTVYRIVVVALNANGYSVVQIVQSTGGIAPVLNALAISGFDASSVTLAQPTFSTAGNPMPSVQAYIGINGTISVSGSTVSNALQGPIDVSSSGYPFNGLSNSTTYRIIVVALNGTGYSVQQIVQSTAGIAPVLNALSIIASDSSHITLAQPTFSIAGNPAPTVEAYIGVDGTITVVGSTVSNSLQGPIDVSSAQYQFSGLAASTTHRIIVVAQNSQGYSVRQIVQSTGGIAPVLNALAISGFDASSITLAQPTFSTAGNPLPTVQAYLGLDGTISISGTTVSNALQGPIDVSGGSHQFNGLTPLTNYRIIVVAENPTGYSVQQLMQSTPGVAPVMNALNISQSGAFSILLAAPTFSTAGNPAPSVAAYIGYNGTISVTGTTVSNYLQGPFDVSGGPHDFTGLPANFVTYRVIVVSQNIAGNSIQQATLFLF